MISKFYYKIFSLHSPATSTSCLKKKKKKKRVTLSNQIRAPTHRSFTSAVSHFIQISVSVPNQWGFRKPQNSNKHPSPEIF